MASSAKILCFLLPCLFISSSHIHARESQLFSKFSSPHTTNTNTNTNTNMLQDTQLETNSNSASNNNMPQDALDATAKPKEEPTFTRANNNGYGLYGSSNTDQESRSTFSNNPTEEYNGGGNSEYMFNNGVPYTTNNNGYETKQYGNGMSDTRYQDNANNNDNNGYETKQYGNGMSDTRYQDNANNNNNYGYEAKSLYGHYKNNQYPVQKQGMSDTRFLENGKYFYDLNNEEMYQNQYQPTRRRNDVFGYSGSRGVNSRNQYNHEGADENLYKFNNYMDNNQENQGGYVP